MFRGTSWIASLTFMQSFAYRESFEELLVLCSLNSTMLLEVIATVALIMMLARGKHGRNWICRSWPKEFE